MHETLMQEYEGQFGNGRSLHDLVGLVEELPPMPDVLTKAVRLTDDPNSEPDDLAKIILQDPSLATPILRIANSAAFGQQREVTSLSTAILLVGMRQIKNMLMATTLRRWNRRFGPMERLVWEKSLGSACAAKILCNALKKKYSDELYLTALLHNLGQIVLLSCEEIRDQYCAVTNRISEYKEDFATAERAVIGFSHPLVGALVAQKWGLGRCICEAILHYADPFEGIFGEQDEKVAMLKLSTGIGLLAGLGCPYGHSVDLEELKQLALAVGMPEDPLELTCFAETQRATKELFASESGAYA
ncbi:MAG: HDOD domain-containing protein [Verrucomicrobia bacterium]|jgi:HD-like signal output (HDOD) protein|nr:MAG: HDOD domain-containing protein [Verrucomicrobiota bacterium]